MSKDQSKYIQFDLMIILISFIIISLLAIYNAQQLGQYPGQNFVLKQIIYYAIGICVIAALQFIDLDQLYKSSLYLYIFGIFLLVFLYFSPSSIARPVNNAKKWFNEIPFITIQPSEFAKIAFILFLAMIICKHKEKFLKQTLNNDLWLILKIVVITIIPISFILKEPDLGTSLVFVFIATILVVLSGIDWKILSLLVVGGVASVILSLLLIVNLPELSQKILGIKPYQIERVMTWFDPTQQVDDDRFQIDRSLQTIGSGQLTGKGMNRAEVALPEAHTDFIFSIIGESFGFIGSAMVIFLFFILIYRLVTLGMKSYHVNPFGAYICFGFMGLILIHTFQNIGMTIGMMPITGIPLLFVSYGGSTTLSTMITFGIVYRVAVEYTQQQSYLFK